MNSIRLALFLLPVLLVAAVGIEEARGEGEFVYTNAAQIHRLSHDQAALKLSARIRGAVTYSDSEWSILFVHDGVDSIYVSLAGSRYPTNGQLIEVFGKTDNGSFLPLVTEASWQPLEATAMPLRMPVPRRIDRPDLFASQIDCEWSEWVGVVRDVKVLRARHLQVDILDRGWRVRAFIPEASYSEEALLRQLIDAKVRIVGVAGIENEDVHRVTGLKFFVPNVANIQVLTPAPGDPFTLPRVPISEIRTAGKTNAPTHRVHVRGVVTYRHLKNELVLQEESSGLQFRTTADNQLKPGDVVEVAAFWGAGSFSPVLEDATVRLSSEQVRVEPVEIAPAKLLWSDFDARLVKVTGTVQSCVSTATNQVLTLLQDGILFGVTLASTNTPKSWKRLEKGDWVRAIGVCDVQGDESGGAQSFRVMARTEGDVAYLSRMHLFTLREVMLILVLGAGGWGLVLLWGIALKRKVAEQTAIISARLEKEIAMEKQLRENEERYASMFQNSLDAILLTDPARRILAVNPAACRIFGYAQEELLQMLFDRLLEPTTAASLADPNSGARHEKSPTMVTLVKNDGVKFPGEISSSKFTDRHGALRTCHVIRDHTERTALEEQLRQAHKLEGVGHLAGGIAHEFNNILGAIMLSLDLVNTRGLDGRNRSMFDEIAMLSRRAADLVRQLLVFSRRSAIQAKILDLNEVVNDFASILRRFMGDKITMEIEESKGLPPIRADRDLIEKMLMNLCLNARDAMPSGGRLNISLGVVEFDAQHIKSRAEAAAGRFICLSVSDTGCGMDESTRKHLFEPFFTTKDVGKGTGLGLAAVYGIVKQHGGWIDVESTLGRSSTFRVYLPVLGEHIPLG